MTYCDVYGSGFPICHPGSRVARVAEVELRKDVEAEACWIESVADGWLFLLTRGEGRGTLIAVGAAVLSLLSTSRLIAERVAGVRVAGSAIRVYPRLRRSLIAGNTIFCGSAAMSFDPLCGEGAGNAVREAFLAAAVVRAGMGGADCGSLKDHYVARLRQGFLRHLEICLQFYATATFGEGWGQELEALRAGITELQMQRAGDPPALFRLVDRDLVAL
jgi:flavin-dependent dehydrogenase